MRHVTGAGPHRASMIAYVAVILLCVLLPFALSFVVDAIALVVRRGAAGVPALVTVAGLAVLIGGTGALVAWLALAVGDTPAAELERAAGLGRGLLLICAPLALAGLLARLWIATLTRRRP
jgi:hypothetical protein